MKKKISVMVLAITLLLSGCVGGDAGDVVSDVSDGISEVVDNIDKNTANSASDFKYKDIPGRDGIRLTKYKGDTSNLVIPPKIHGKKVLQIGSNFVREENDTIEYIEIPSTVETIYEDAFSLCYGVRSVVFHEGIIEIGDSAFTGCEKLENVNFPDGLQSIGDSAFSSTKLEEVIIPNSVTYVGSGAFQLCSELKSISFGTGVTAIQTGVCNWCENLETVDIGNAKEVYGDAFTNSDNIKTVRMSHDVNIALGAFSCEYTTVYNDTDEPGGTGESDQAEGGLDSTAGADVNYGDTVRIKYDVSIYDVPYEPASETIDLVVGSGTMIEGFEDTLVLYKVGESFSVDLDYPSDYPGTIELDGEEIELAGSPASFYVTILGKYTN